MGRAGTGTDIGEPVQSNYQILRRRGAFVYEQKNQTRRNSATGSCVHPDETAAQCRTPDESQGVREKTRMALPVRGTAKAFLISRRMRSKCRVCTRCFDRDTYQDGDCHMYPEAVDYTVLRIIL